MGSKKFKETTIKWLGGYDYYRINYMIYILGSVWMINQKNIPPEKATHYKITRIIVTILKLIVLIDMAFDIFLVYENVERLSYSLSTSIFFTGSLLHFFSLHMKMTEMEDCLELINNNFHLDTVGKSKSDLEILNSGEKELKKVSKLFYCLFGVGLMARIVCHLAPAEKMMMLPFPYSDKIDSPLFELLFFFQTLGLIHFMVVLIASEMVALGFLIQITKHFEIVEKNVLSIKNLYSEVKSLECLGGKRLMFRDLVLSYGNPPDIIKGKMKMERQPEYSVWIWRKNTASELIRNTIIHHQQILSITRRMNLVLNASFSLQIFGGGILIALLFLVAIWESQNLSVRTVAQSIYACGFLLNIFTICFYGSQVEIRSHNAANALYSIPWFKMDLENRKTIIFLLKSLWRHPIVKAGGFVPFNLSTYLQFLHLIYNSMAIMQSTLR